MAGPNYPDTGLILKSASGNRKAFATLFKRYFQLKYSFDAPLALIAGEAKYLPEDINHLSIRYIWKS